MFIQPASSLLSSVSMVYIKVFIVTHKITYVYLINIYIYNFNNKLLLFKLF